MAEKKRKSVVSAPGPPAKKNKKSTGSESASKAASEPIGTTVTTNDAVARSRSNRKRASDYLDDTASLPADLLAAEHRLNGKSETNAEPESNAPSKIKSQSAASGAKNEHADIASNNTNATATLESPADNESQDENTSEDEDQGAVLLAGFDSDSDDLAEDQGDLSKTQPIPQYKKTSKKLKQAKEKGSDGPGTVYVGRIPHGFYEHQMRDYFTQFGNITRLRISRNKRTGASKHFAFIEFESDEVAKIVAETMDNYLMFGHILKCKYAPSENLHPDVWKGANKKFRKIPHDKLERQRLEAPKTQQQWAKKNEKEQKKRKKQAEKLKAIGYEYIVPQLTNPADVIEQKMLDQKESEQAHAVPQVTDEDKADAIEAPPSVPADEVVMKKEKKSKRGKNGGNSDDLLTKGNLDARNAGPAAESAKKAQNTADKENDIISRNVRRQLSNGTSIKKRGISKRETTSDSIVTESSHNQYEGLSSIPVGIEAAPESVTDANIMPDPDKRGNIFTHAGVADSVLKGRRKDRKRDRNARKLVKNSPEETVSALAPGAAGRDKVEKAKELQKKQVKGILKNGKKESIKMIEPLG